MKYVLFINICIITLSGCMKGDWQNIHPCNEQETGIYNTAMDFAENVYRNKAEELIAANWQADQPIDLDHIFTVIHGAEKMCGTIPVDSDVQSGDPIIQAEANWSSDEIYLNTDGGFFFALQWDFFDESAQGYGELTDEDKLLLLWPGTTNNFNELRQDALYYYMSPKFLAGALVHEGVHLYYGESSRHTVSSEEIGNLCDQWSNDVCCSADHAIKESADNLFVHEEAHLNKLYDMIWDEEWLPPDYEK
jgi:hypothetical protein